MSEHREKILAAACGLYLQDGFEGFSMRKLACAVGVTAPAIYRHYDSKEKLLLDVVGEGYRRLAEYLYRSLEGRTPEERFRLSARAYASFALENARMYEVLYSFPDLLGMPEVPPDLEARACAVGQFWKDRVRECVDAGMLRESWDPDEVGQTLWSHAHGLISLYLNGMLRVDQDVFWAMFAASTDRLLAGLASEEYGQRLLEQGSKPDPGSRREPAPDRSP